MKIIEIDGDYGIVENQGVQMKIGLMLLKDIGIHDWVMVHAGFAIARLDESEAQEILDWLKAGGIIAD